MVHLWGNIFSWPHKGEAGQHPMQCRRSLAERRSVTLHRVYKNMGKENVANCNVKMDTNNDGKVL